MRPLFVVVKADKCTVSSGGDVDLPSSYKVPVSGGSSLPYVIDFTKCLPETDVGVTVRAMWNTTLESSNITIVQSKSTTFAMPLTFASGAKSLLFSI